MHPIVAPLAVRAQDFLRAAQASNTLRAYAADWRDFGAWCARQGRETLPATPETVALYLTDLAASAKASTLARRVATISQAHHAAGIEDSPTRHVLVRKVMAGIRRSKGSAQEGKRPLETADLLRLVARLDPSRPLDARDRALLLLGFAGALRRSELVALDIADVERTREGLVLAIRRSKTDPEGQGRRIGIPYGATAVSCPVRAYGDWLTQLGAATGPIFRAITPRDRIQIRRLSSQSVALIVKRRAAQAGLDPTRYAGHSLRAGLATSAAAAGVSERAIMNQTGHRSVLTLRKYIREGSLFLENAAARVGL